uniref:Uncharacterized protein n=1 Tax=Arundo donax TaxID=35708 RepID=A0A0A8YD91_ARUDO
MELGTSARAASVCFASSLVAWLVKVAQNPNRFEASFR